jgi:hypothetical protein
MAQSEAVAIGVKSKDGVISHAVNGLVRPVQQQYTTRMSARRAEMLASRIGWHNMT